MPDETPDPTDAETPARVPDSSTGDAASDEAPDRDPDTPPAAVVDEAERLTRLAREARPAASPPRDEEVGGAALPDDAEATAYREARADLLADHGYTARVREDETRDVLVLHPVEWVEDGTIRPERVDDVDRGIEIPLSGPGEADDWAVIDEHNRELVAAVRAEHGDVHGANAAALADFVGNHYAKPIGSATGPELREFLAEYYPRNAWPTDEQRGVVEESLRLVFDVADERYPLDG